MRNSTHPKLQGFCPLNHHASEITRLLSIEPSRAHKKGDCHLNVSRKGKVRKAPPFKEGLWALDSSIEDSENFDFHFQSILKQLEPAWMPLKEISTKGYKMDMFCGAFSNAGEQTGVEISHPVIQRLGELNVSIGICFYSLDLNKEVLP